MSKIMTEIFCFVDEFCKFYENEVQKISLTSVKKQKNLPGNQLYRWQRL